MNDVDEPQQRFWQELVQIRIDIYYLSRYYTSTEKIETYYNIFLATASNGSIAAWAIWDWDKGQIVWAIIIGASQLLNAIRPYLPYQHRMKAIIAMNRELEKIALNAEHKRYAVSQGDLTNTEINDEIADVREKKRQADEANFGFSPLQRKGAFLKEAEKQAQTYFYANYGVGGEEDA